MFALITGPFLEGGTGSVVESARLLCPRGERGMSPKHARAALHVVLNSLFIVKKYRALSSHPPKKRLQSVYTCG